VLPDVFLPHAEPDQQYQDACLRSQHIAATALQALEHDRVVEIARA